MHQANDPKNIGGHNGKVPGHPLVLRPFTHKGINRVNALKFARARAASLARQSLLHISQRTNNNRVRNILSHDFYLDDELSESDNKKEPTTTMRNLSDEQKKYCMTLTKFSSNAAKTIKTLLKELTSEDVIKKLTNNKKMKTLGR
jgi:hypothetical protein